jgi:hypothetical protein
MLFASVTSRAKIRRRSAGPSILLSLGRRIVAMTFQPLSRKSWAVVLPKPEEHPVMRTAFLKVNYSANLLPPIEEAL